MSTKQHVSPFTALEVDRISEPNSNIVICRSDYLHTAIILLSNNDILTVSVSSRCLKIIETLNDGYC